MPTLKVDDAHVEYRVEGAGRPLVLVHGVGPGSVIWDQTVADFSDNSTVVLPDLSGGDRVADDGGELTIEKLAAQLAAVIEDSGVAPVALLGFSLGAPVAAADFDEAGNIVLVDATREDGDAVAPAGPGAAWVLFRDTDLGALGPAGPVTASTVTLRVAREEPGPARAQLWRRDPGHSDLLAAFTVPSTGSRYAWAEVTAALTRPEGADRGPVADLCLVLDGAQRVAWFRLAAGGPT